MLQTILLQAIVCLIHLTRFGIVATNEAGLQWLEEKKGTDAAVLVELPSGLLYKVMSEGNGNFHPSFDTYCQVDMELSRINVDGTSEIIVEADTEQIRPEDSTMAAIREALQLMVDGDWWELYVPSHLGSSSGKVRRKDTHVEDEALLVVSLELVSVLHGDKIPKGETHACDVALVDDSTSTGHYLIVKPTESCDERDATYIQKVSEWENRSVKAEEELARLKSVQSKGNGMKQSLAVWVRRRMHILKLLLREDMRVCRIHFGGTPGHHFLQAQEDCNALEQEYVWKVLDWSAMELDAEISRLHHMNQTSMDTALASWVRRRLRILTQILRANKEPTQDSSQGATSTDDAAAIDNPEEAPLDEPSEQQPTQSMDNDGEL